MSSSSTTKSTPDSPPARLWDGVRAKELPRTVGQDARALYHFYVDEDRRGDAARMHPLKRAVLVPFWILRALLLRLTPARRVLLAAAFVFALIGKITLHPGDYDVTLDTGPWPFLILLFVLALELKDKLLARDEIAVARQVQLALLPSSDPQPPGFGLASYTAPANDVGGDLIDFLDSPTPGRLGVALGDVAGKGLGAALLMAKLQASLHAVAPGCHGLDELGRRMNGILCRDGLDNRFATLFYAELPTDGSPAGAIRTLNAGHNPPLVVREGRVERLTESGRPLGMFPDSTYTEGTVVLAAGDLLLIYSDGLVEARDGADQEYGLDRLERLAPRLRGRSAADAARLLIDDVRRFLGELRPQDDLSILIVVRQAPERLAERSAPPLA